MNSETVLTKRKYTKEQLEDIDFMLQESLKAVKEGRVHRCNTVEDRLNAGLADVKAGRVRRA